MTINIRAHDMELTQAIRDYAEEKMQSLEKFLDSINQVDIEVGRANGSHQKGDVFECKVAIQIGGNLMKVEREADDLYKAIDKVRDHLRVELTEWKRMMDERNRAGEKE
ncbi:MAG: ribosome-associated translation inhibitor RaiA [Candidatus Uhrbacteria bacterium]